MVTTLYLVRHGSIDSGGTKRYYGSMDVPLLEEGVGQMKGARGLIKRYLADVASAKQQLTAVYCSDLQRAIRSAEIIAELNGLVPIQVPTLRERSFGIWEGMTFNEIKEKYPLEFDAWAGNPVKYNPIGGESTLDVELRVTRAVDNIVASHPGGDIAVVAHGGVNRIILCDIMGIPLENIFRIEQDYAAVNIIEFWEKYPVVKLLNGRVYT
jgi:alpha-ribazole phosphatase